MASQSRATTPVQAPEGESTLETLRESSGDGQGATDLAGTWPHALSHEPMLRVSDVLALVQQEFPTLTTSKLRFLDAHGLVCPRRTPAGYRQYSPADVERLRFVLRQQRDHYRPLTVIGTHLDALDSGRMQEGVEPHLLDGDDPAYLTASAIAARAGVEESVVVELSAQGIIREGVPGKYSRSCLPLVVAAAAYLRSGGDVRSMRTLRNSASRESDLARQAVAPIAARGHQGEAEARAQEWGEAAISLFSACVRTELSS